MAPLTLQQYQQMMIMATCLNKSMVNITEPTQNLSPEAILERKFHYYCMEIGIPTVCAFGLVGNILNLMVLTREKIHCTLTKMEKSAHIGLIALAVSDFMFCFLALMFTILPLQREYKELSSLLYYEWLGSCFITMFIITSTWLIVVMAGERYLAVCHPFTARKIISLRKTRITIMLVYGLCICATIPLFFENAITKTRCVDNTVIYQVENQSGKEMERIRRMIWAVFFDFLPSAALLYFNVCLIYKIHKAKKIRREMAPGQSQDIVIYRAAGRENSNSTNHNYSERDYTQLHSMAKSSCITRNNGHIINTTAHSGYNNKRQAQIRRFTKNKKKQSDNALNSVTATLVAVVVLFLILVSPSEVLKFTYTKIRSDTSGQEYIYRIIKWVTNFMQALNFSFNFVLYCAVNKSFRNTLAGIFCFCSRTNLLDNIKTTRLHQSTGIHELS